MQIYDFMFIISFIGFVSLILYSLYNILNNFEIFDFKKGIIIFIINILLWFITLIVFLIYPLRTIYMVLFNVSNILLGLNLLFFVIEIFNLWYVASKGAERGRHEPEARAYSR